MCVCVVSMNGGQNPQVWNQYLTILDQMPLTRLGTVGCFHLQIGRSVPKYGRISVQRSHLYRRPLSPRDLGCSRELVLVGHRVSRICRVVVPGHEDIFGGLPRPKNANLTVTMFLLRLARSEAGEG